MAIVSQTKLGYFLDCRLFVNNVYANSRRIKLEANGHFAARIVRCRMLEALFNISEPFRMDSEYAAMQNNSQQSTHASNAQLKKIKKQRKRKFADMKSATLSDLATQQLLSVALADVLAGAKLRGFPLSSSYHVPSNNASARAACKIEGPGNVLKDSLAATQLSCESLQEYTINEENLRQTVDIPSLFNVMVTVDLKQPSIVPLFGATYLLPEKCAFLMSDMDHVGLLAAGHDSFDFIVIDPPWENKSVKRKKTYGTLRNEDFLHLPVQGVANDCCIVACWVTNRRQHIRYLKDVLFAAWGVTFAGEWHWLKVTTHGEAVQCLQSAHKKPYETLVIGQCRRLADKHGAASAKIAAHRTLVSVPCCLHSSKPPLVEIFRPLLPQQPRCLELFARNLQPGFTSWGNEVLRHQHTDFYDIDEMGVS